MTSQNTLVGRLGRHDVGGTLVARLKEWNVNPTLATNSEWGDSDTAGYTARAAGRKDATFGTNGVYDTTTEVFDIFQEGDISDSTLWMNITDLYWNFPRSLCMDFSLSVNVDTQEVIGWESEWGADGIYYRPGDANIPSKSFPS